MQRRIGACLGCLAFAVAICGGLLAGNSIETTVRRAIFALFAFFALGLFVGWVSELMISERQDQLGKELEEKATSAAMGSPSVTDDLSELEEWGTAAPVAASGKLYGGKAMRHLLTMAGLMGLTFAFALSLRTVEKLPFVQFSLERFTALALPGLASAALVVMVLTYAEWRASRLAKLASVNVKTWKMGLLTFILSAIGTGTPIGIPSRL